MAHLVVLGINILHVVLEPNITIILILIPLYCCRVVFFNFRLMRVFPHESFLDFLLVVGGLAR